MQCTNRARCHWTKYLTVPFVYEDAKLFLHRLEARRANPHEYAQYFTAAGAVLRAIQIPDDSPTSSQGPYHPPLNSQAHQSNPPPTNAAPIAVHPPGVAAALTAPVAEPPPPGAVVYCAVPTCVHKNGVRTRASRGCIQFLCRTHCVESAEVAIKSGAHRYFCKAHNVQGNEVAASSLAQTAPAPYPAQSVHGSASASSSAAPVVPHSPGPVAQHPISPTSITEDDPLHALIKAMPPDGLRRLLQATQNAIQVLPGTSTSVPTTASTSTASRSLTTAEQPAASGSCAGNPGPSSLAPAKRLAQPISPLWRDEASSARSNALQTKNRKAAVQLLKEEQGRTITLVIYHTVSASLWLLGRCAMLTFI